MVLNWRSPQRFSRNDARSPYAHWWLEFEEPGSSARRVEDVPAVDIRALLEDLDGDRDPALLNFFVDQLDALLAPLRSNLQLDQINAERNTTDHRDLDFGAPLSPGSSIVAIIDDGIPFAHERLRTAEGTTRVAWTWLQGAPVARRPDETASDLAFGRELDRREINALMEGATRGGRIDEDEVYRNAGFQDFARSDVQSTGFRATHGASVADIAAGAEPGALDDVHVLAVSLPSSVIRDTSGAFVAFYIVFAIKAIFDRVEQMIDQTRDALQDQSFDAPVIVNISYGLTAGPKDGTGLVERFIEDRLSRRAANRPPILFTLPAGNHRLTRTRARLERPARGAGGLRWRLLPDDTTPSFLEIRGQPRDARPVSPSLTLQVAQPNASTPVAATAPAQFGVFANLTSGDDIIGRAYFVWEPADLRAPDGRGREAMVLVLRPTLPAKPKDPFAHPGDWLVRPVATGADLASFPLDLFVQRDDTIPGYRNGGRQSRFDDTAYQLFDASGRVVETDQGSASAILRSGTLNALGSSASVHVVGAAVPNEPINKTLGFSGIGFSFGDPPNFRRGPDFLAITEESPVLRRVLTTGTLSGSHTAVTGTSFAAPRLARAFAEGLLGIDWSRERRRSAPDQVLGLGSVNDRLDAADIVVPL